MATYILPCPCFHHVTTSHKAQGQIWAACPTPAGLPGLRFLDAAYTTGPAAVQHVARRSTLNVRQWAVDRPVADSASSRETH
jgi:hypothetical protein